MLDYKTAKGIVMQQKRLQSEREREEKIKNGYARVSKDGEVYLDFSDRRTQLKMKSEIEKFSELSDDLKILD